MSASPIRFAKARQAGAPQDAVAVIDASDIALA
jgi:hypothetical protein